MRPIHLTGTFLLLIGCTPAGSGQVVPVAPPAGSCAPLAAVDSVSLMRDVSRLADDSMRGRLFGSADAIRARDYLAARFDEVGLATVGAGRMHEFPVASTRDSITRAWNVVGMVRGTEHPDQYIVVTAHYDHVGVGRPVAGDSIYNGADDNASGASALVAIGRMLMAEPPRHSVILAAVDGEERGMWGSRYFVDAPTVPLDRILVNVNMDMIGRNVGNELYAAGPGRYPALAPLVAATAVCAPITLRMGHDTPAAGPGDDWTSQSDHASFHRRGIPFVYFGEEDHPDYHRPGDTAERLMPAFYVGSVRTVAAFIRRFDHAPVARTTP